MKKWVVLAVAMAMLLFAPTVQAQQVFCGPRADVVAQLATKYGETRVLSATHEGRLLFEVYTSETGGTWTIARTSTRGEMCLLAVGFGFEVHDQPAPGTDS